jgi:hypothetical protein
MLLHYESASAVFAVPDDSLSHRPRDLLCGLLVDLAGPSRSGRCMEALREFHGKARRPGAKVC